METYDDITSIDRYQITSEDEVYEYVRSCDLRDEALGYLQGGHQDAEFLRAGAYNTSAVEVLYLPEVARGGIAWGADAVWTDADSADDALERFFGVDGKEMIA